MTQELLLNKSIDVNAPVSMVWDALTKPAIIKEWLYGTNTISEWKIGSPILFMGTFNGKEYKDKGIILQLEKEKILQYTYWSGFSGLPDTPENYSIVTFLLKTAADKTVLTLTQSNYATETAYERSEKSWKTTLELMKTIIEK
jgi:uncharacterized protein YndB with AHSA1/START domain